MSGLNTITRAVAPKSAFESAKNVISSAVSFNQGDLLVLDTTTHLLKVAALEADGANFQGVAVVTVVSGKIASPYNTDVVASQSVQDVAGPVVGVVVKAILKTGEALNSGGLVYLDPATGTRGVAASGTKPVGVYQGAVISSAAAGQEIEIYIGSALIGSAIVA